MKTSSPDWLSPRECEVLLHLARGESFKWIGLKLDIQQSTAQTLAYRAYQKLGVRDRWEAVARHPWHRLPAGQLTPGAFCNRIVSIASTAIAASSNI